MIMMSYIWNFVTYPFVFFYNLWRNSFNSEKLVCTRNISDDSFIPEGRISFCLKKGSVHTFILIESGSYREGVWAPDSSNVSLAFSYVPEPTFKYLEKFYENHPAGDHGFVQDAHAPISSLWGYIFFLFTDSHVVDTWKLGDEFIRLGTKPLKGWSFQRYPQFKTYNVLSLIPFFGITDCIGYSYHHYVKHTTEKIVNE